VLPLERISSVISAVAAASDDQDDGGGVGGDDEMISAELDITTKILNDMKKFY
jgi:hypothetical protein